MKVDRLEEEYLKKTLTSAKLAERACHYMPGGDTHGHFYNPPYHTTIDRGEGCYLYDVDGNRYIDCVNAYFVLIHGHCFSPIVNALERQIKRGTSFGMPTEDQIEYAQHLCERIPSLDEVRFVASGSEATNMAIRAARAFTGKRKIMKVDGGYHGTHNIGELNSFGASERGSCKPMPAIGAHGSEINDIVLFPWNDKEALQRIISENVGDVAGLIIEPIVVVGGIITPEPGFLKAVRELTREKGIVLIFDEVVTLPFSYGGMQEYYGVTPDLTAMGKGIGGGLPIGAWGGRRDIVELWNPERGHDAAVMMVSTFGGNAMTMAAGLAAMTHLTPEVIEQRNALADQLRKGIDETFKSVSIRGHASGLCNAFWIHWTDHPVKDPYDAVDAMLQATDSVRNLLFMGMRYRGVYLFPSPSPFGNISTPIGDKEIDHVINALEETLMEIRPVIEDECPDLLI
jgi:glutamate-1-semialdehyde 2,1-aminomutase